jgi:hypothetical protein
VQLLLEEGVGSDILKVGFSDTNNVYSRAVSSSCAKASCRDRLLVKKQLKDRIMAIVLQLEPELESRLIAQAAAQGKSAEELLKTIVEQLLLTALSTPISLSPQERAERFLRWSKSHASLQAPLLSDEVISRESIYTREDEMP